MWGSLWRNGKWGFKCCGSFIRESYCTGAAGIEAAQSSLPGIDEQHTIAATSTSEEAGTETQLETPAASERVQVEGTEISDVVADEEAELKEAIEKLKRKQEEKRRKRREKKRRKNKKKSKAKKKKDDSDSRYLRTNIFKPP